MECGRIAFGDIFYSVLGSRFSVIGSKGDVVEIKDSNLDTKAIESAIRQILTAIGENPDRPELANTPARVAKMYAEIFEGVGEPPEKEFHLYRIENMDEMILVKDIPFYSMCEHHLLPFWGTVSIAYIPNDNQVTGFANLLRVVESFARRPQIQERMGTQIADFLMQHLKPMGVMVIIEANHMCIAMRGPRKENSRTISSAIRGAFRKTATRLEALALLGKR
jgi:GTP cyclohydrolase I